MIRRIITFSAENRWLVLFVTFLFLTIAWFSLKNIQLDALPDLSDTQVIVYSRWMQSPQVIEDQVTYPIVSALLGAPGVKVVRGFSDYGYSFVYVIFEDGTDIYWARSRVLEYLAKISSALPEGVKTELGPDATGVGWVYQYALLDRSGSLKPDELRSLQDFQIRYQLLSVEGVAEVASIGGYKKQYQIALDPNALANLKIPLNLVAEKIRESNRETGARLLEINGAEYMIRARGYIRSVSELGNISLRSNPETGVPVLLSHVATISTGPDLSRGASDYNGQGELPSGIVVMRHGENAPEVIARVKKKLEEIRPGLPKGVEIIPVYDRSELIGHAMDNLRSKLAEEIFIVSAVILFFLWHFPSAIIPIFTIPAAILLTFIPLSLFQINANLMSLSGIAISIGVLVDGAIIEVENAYRKLEEWQHSGQKGDYHAIRLAALLEVGPSVFFSLLVIAVAFFPVFTLVEQEGRLFRPLAISKNLTMLMAAILAITLDPALRMLFTRMEPFRFKNRALSAVATSLLVGKYHAEEKHPISRWLFKVYTPVCHFVLKHARATILAAIISVLAVIPLYFKLGTEFMPPLYEESLLYMPTTMPGISLDEAKRLLMSMDKKLKAFPEVKSVLGKTGRADSSTDPSPLSMFETVILLNDPADWRKKERFYHFLPGFLQAPFRFLWPDRISKDELVDLLDRELAFPGVSNAWTMPIKGRLDMLATGFRTPVGIKIQGSSPAEIERLGIEIENILRQRQDVRSVFAERSSGGYYVEIDILRESIARHGLSVAEVQQFIAMAIGGESVTETIEGHERYSVNLRYPRDFRDSLEGLKNTLYVAAGHVLPLGEIADIHLSHGPAMLRNEDGFLTGYVYIEPADSDLAAFVHRLQKEVREKLILTPGYSLVWSGQYENILRVEKHMSYVLPVTFLLILFLLFLNTRSWVKTMLVLMAVPFSMIGAILLLYFAGYQMSVAVWVGLIALLGLDAETGVFMLMYLDLSFSAFQRENRLNHLADLREAVVHGAVFRLRPKLMTVLAAFLGLLPIMWSDGAGSDMMKRIAAPMVGGLFTSFLLELLLYPPVYYLWKKKTLGLQEEPEK